MSIGNGHLPASTGLPDHSSASDSEPESNTDYLPITGSAASDTGTDTDTDTDTDPDLSSHHRLGAIGNGISGLDLASDNEDANYGGEADEEEQCPAEAAAAWALAEDERRRRAPLPADAAARIVDAMRGVAFPGAPPSWADSIPDDQWLDRLRSLRGGPN